MSALGVLPCADPVRPLARQRVQARVGKRTPVGRPNQPAGPDQLVLRAVAAGEMVAEDLQRLRNNIRENGAVAAQRLQQLQTVLIEVIPRWQFNRIKKT